MAVVPSTPTVNGNAEKRTRWALLVVFIITLTTPLRDLLKKSIIDIQLAGRALTEQEVADKLPLIHHLEKAGVTVSNDMVRKLPTWSEVVNLYGSEPIIYGLETCEAFRANNVDNKIIISPSGLHNTGTNFLRVLIKDNCDIGGGSLYSPWWKHGPVSWAHNPDYLLWRQKNQPIREGDHYKNIFPIVMVKDPFHWMASMCRHPYSVEWNHQRYSCPNLVPTRDYINVKVHFNKTVTNHYSSMVDLWNKWNDGHFHEATYPRLMIRYEDLLFHTEHVVKAACECVGGKYSKEFKYKVETSKPDHSNTKSATSVSSAMIRYGSSLLRLEGFKYEDRQFARIHLDADLMEKFRYIYP